MVLDICSRRHSSLRQTWAIRRPPLRITARNTSQRPLAEMLNRRPNSPILFDEREDWEKKETKNKRNIFDLIEADACVKKGVDSTLPKRGRTSPAGVVSTRIPVNGHEGPSS